MMWSSKPRRTETIEQLKVMDYQQYLGSYWWRLCKKINRKRECEKCGFNHELDLHHLNYENRGEEKSGDLITLCRRCHRDIHFYNQKVKVSERMVRQNYTITEGDYKAHALADGG